MLRWTWRVQYYAIGAFATDRYPPFSLQDDPEYPAHFDVEYPAALVPQAVLVKWWLLAIPHYLVLSPLHRRHLGHLALRRAGQRDSP